MNSATDEPRTKRPRREETQVQSPVTFDDSGELLLRVGGDHTDEPALFLVCSRALIRLSKVFSKMLNGGFAESRTVAARGRDWQVDLPDDDPKVLRVLMNVMHGRVHEVPEMMELEELWTVMVAADKYDIVYLLRPWALVWVEAVKHRTDVSLLLGIAWQLRNRDLVLDMMHKIAEESGFDENGELYYEPVLSGEGTRIRSGDRQNLSDSLQGLVPSQTFDSIIDLRERQVTAELQPYADLVQSFVRGRVCRVRCELQHRKICDNNQLAVVVKGFLRQGVNVTLPHPHESYDGTVRGLKRVLQRVDETIDREFRSQAFSDQDMKPLLFHRECDERLRRTQKRAEREATRNPIQLTLPQQHLARFLWLECRVAEEPLQLRTGSK